ncbi:MAG: zinc ribbon domain-containing protein, partial [Gemmatimonas sp.]
MSDVKQLIQNVRRSLASTYEILGYVGVDGSGAQVLLGRDLAINALVGIVAREDATNGAPLSVDVQRTLGRTVMVSGSMCPECRTPLPELDAFCFHCGANLSGSTAPVGTPDSAMVLAALATATSGRYEILGRLDREGATGAAYFARDLASDNIAALRLTRVEAVDASKPEYIERLTNIFETGAIQAQMAERKAQQDAERAAA